ncbi:MAG: helicase-related protein [Chloroflexota bacterium]|nr:helicase-related protein [Chloroflexota bacterium]
MAKLEDLKQGTKVRGIVPGQTVSVVDAKWHGSTAVELFYKYADGQPGTQLLFRNDELNLEIAETRRAWRFNADGDLFRLVAEAYRIHLAYLFDPVLAVHTSLIEPLPHQIIGVYGDMLPRQPLRFLLADDPGAGKTIMAGLFIKELIVRGDVHRCLICVPGNLAAQWQDELWFKFQLRFEILTREAFETAVSGNPFLEKDRVIIRLDQIARNEDLKEKLRRTDWDLVVVDEAHKMSAHFWGGELEETKRYKLGKLLRDITRHFLLMTATPHNGKEEDFQLFLALLDQDRFAGRFREGVHEVDISDIMRRMIKEDLRRFDGRPLFPERRAYTVSYPLSPGESRLYDEVTDYVRTEFNRADKLADDKRKGTVGFALIILQRRLASSPEAIYQSLKRRRQRLEKQLTETRNADILSAGEQDAHGPSLYDQEYLDGLDDAPAEEVEAIEEQIIDNATAALTIAELKAEIETLKHLETMAYRVRQSGTDRKWEELATIIQDDERMVDRRGQRRKFVIFTEHRDTLTYLWERISTLFGRDDVLVSIHGSIPREKRRATEDRFRNDPDVYFLLATDAAGEGINLQRAHLMINYDLPWNPNRLEQRFGRIHRIGQTEVCHLWNLVAGETREGYVYARLLRKLETEGRALEGQVFDVLGALFEQTPLRRLLVEAIRYGDQPEVRAKLEQTVDNAVDRERVRKLLETRSLVTESMDTTQIVRIREEMERYAARRLQPHYIRSFFMQAFETLGGSVREREPGRYRIGYVPARIRNRARELGTTVPVWEKYDRICFDKELMGQVGLPQADFVCPGHPLLDTVIDLVLDKHRETLRSGAVLVDPTDPGQVPRVLFFLGQNIQDTRTTEACAERSQSTGAERSQSSGDKRLISREVHFVEIDEGGNVRAGGYAPYLDYEPATPEQLAILAPVLEADWLTGDHLETRVLEYAIENLVPRHLARVRKRREELIDKTLAAVHERLTKEINYWDKRAAELRQQEKAGKVNVRLNAARAQQRADELAARLERRTEELALERQISATPPVVFGGAIVIPAGLLLGERTPPELLDTRVTEAIAMQAVMQAEAALDNHPRDVSKDNLGYDVESLDPCTSRLRFIEVKGRRAGADTVTVTRNEILTGINSPDQYILAIVEVEDGKAHPPHYIRKPFKKEPDFGVTSVNYNLKELLAQSEAPT